MTKLTEQDLIDIAEMLHGIADDLYECGIDEWESLEDCIQGTSRNVQYDLAGFVEG